MAIKSNKDLLDFIFAQMSSLESGKIDNDTARSQATLAKQANNSLRYELDRANLQMKLSEHNNTTGDDINIRNIEKG